MEVILTHEHADFDAVASMVGLARLVPGAVPVLPMAVNANVRDFITLYGRQLPLRRRDEVGRGPVTHAWVVDTGHPASIRGMAADTPRTVIDHHVAAEPGGRAGADDDVQAVGATATLIVERQRAAGITPPPVEATLLLLGIHEDTGSLTYAGTTPRDLRAAAWLLEHGADLPSIDRFLRRTLSEAARAVFLALTDAAEAAEVHGHRIIVSKAEATGFDEEVSPLATKLMDLLEPDALFVVVDTGAVQQVVGRSRTTDIDAAVVARRLGGGGHPHASAATLRGQPTAAVQRAILDALPAAVRPTTRVEDVMSHGPLRTLEADTTVADAVQVCRRYGHEGYPVVDGDTVLGVVTRRDLDRATHHHLGRLAVRQIVTGHGVSIAPTDTVAELQRRMTTHNLGQVPVVDDARLVGIVTRGDLLRLWSTRAGQAAPATVVDVAGALPPSDVAAIRQVAGVARERGDRAFLVGGLPRDLLLGVAPGPDIDLVVVGDAVALAHAVAARHGGTVKVHPRFGTAKWRRERGVSIDLVSARTEHYRAPTALPTVERGSLRSDLERRDFTINALAVDVDPDRFGAVVDLFNGLDDLRAGVIRVLHPLSFVEDPTRLLRAARFETRYGFRMDPTTAAGAPSAVGLLPGISGARIRNELVQLFGEREPAVALARLAELGVLDAIAAGLTAGGRTGRLLDALPAAWAAWRRAEPDMAAGPGPLDRLVLWLAENAAPGVAAAERLAVPGRVMDRLRAVLALRAPHPAVLDRAARPSAVAAAIAGHPPDAVALAWLAADDPVCRARLWRFAREWAHMAPLISGADLLALGVPRGPRIGAVLGAVRAAQLDGGAPDRAAALALARTLLADPIDDPRPDDAPVV